VKKVYSDCLKKAIVIPIQNSKLKIKNLKNSDFIWVSGFESVAGC
jgi:hypothetical protein